MRRTWRPNVHPQSLFSELLGCKLQFRTTTSVLRTIDKMGGLDNYLLRTPDKKLDSALAVKTKRLLETQLEAVQRTALSELGGGEGGAERRAPGRRWSEKEEARLQALCLTQGTDRKQWAYKALQLGTGRSPAAVETRWRRRLDPALADAERRERLLGDERAERRVTRLQEASGCDRGAALRALRRHGEPGQAYGGPLVARALRDLGVEAGGPGGGERAAE